MFCSKIALLGCLSLIGEDRFYLCNIIMVYFEDCGLYEFFMVA